MISPVWGLIERVREPQPSQVAGCHLHKIFPNPPRTPTHAGRGPCSFLSALNPPRIALGLCKEDPSSLFGLSICWWGQAKGQLLGCARQFGDSRAGLTWQGGRSQPPSPHSAHSTPVHPLSGPHLHHGYSQPCLPETGVGWLTLGSPEYIRVSFSQAFVR